MGKPDYNLGNYAERLRLGEPLDLRVPPFPLRNDLVSALGDKLPDKDGVIRILPGVDVSPETLKSLAEFLSRFASDSPGKPVDLMEGFSLQTDSVNKAFRMFGGKSKLPNGFSVIFSQERQFVGFTIGGEFP